MRPTAASDVILRSVWCLGRREPRRPGGVTDWAGSRPSRESTISTTASSTAALPFQPSSLRTAQFQSNAEPPSPTPSTLVCPHATSRSARHADPRTNERYDRARGRLDRHGSQSSPPTSAGT